MVSTSVTFTRLMAASRLDALVTPAAIGTAPEPHTTGDPAFNSPWSYTGLPTVSFPIGLAPDNLPVAVQLIGHIYDDTALIGIAGWCEQAIQPERQ
jgi:aspartyl-tRNA(Asn)/glutamyl-tRNA(Gln) amidotransferase subunit A